MYVVGPWLAGRGPGKPLEGRDLSADKGSKGVCVCPYRTTQPQNSCAVRDKNTRIVYVSCVRYTIGKSRELVRVPTEVGPVLLKT
jgi:hypothetical protein